MLRRALFVNFHSVYRLDRWLRRRLSQTGAVLLVLCMSAAVFGINIRQTLSYQLFAFTAAALLVSLASLPFRRARLLAVRRLPRYATAGEPLRYAVRVRNLGSRSLRGASLAEYPIAARPSYAEFFRLREPGDRLRNWFDRYVGYPRWAHYMSWRLGAQDATVELPELAPGAEATVEAVLVPVRRGWLQLDPPHALRPDPLGLVRSSRSCGARGRVLVLPRRHPMAALRSAGALPRGHTGSDASARLGGGEDFAALREYRAGDPLRHIHWRSWARLGQPVVMEFHDRKPLRHAVLLDTASPGGDSAQFEAAVSAAASVIAALPAGGAGLHLLCAGAPRGPVPAARALETLACVRPGGVADLGLLLEALPRAAHDLGGCVAVLLALDEARAALLHELKRCGVAVTALVVCAQDEPVPEGTVAGVTRHLLRPATLARDLAAAAYAAADQGRHRVEAA